MADAVVSAPAVAASSVMMSSAMNAAFGGAALAHTVGSAAAPWVMVIVGAVLGATAAVAERHGVPGGSRVYVFLTGVVLSTLTSGSLSVLIGQLAGVSAEFVVFPLAGLIAWKQRSFFDAIWHRTAQVSGLHRPSKRDAREDQP